MAKLNYSMLMSLDGYVADDLGNFDWAAPGEDVHTFVNDLMRPAGTYLYGRRMYEVLVAWETAHTFADQRPFIQDFARIWQGVDKIVFSKTLAKVSSARTRIERDFDPEAVRQMKAGGTRHHGGRARPRLPGDEGRVARRVPSVRHARHRGRRNRALPDGCRVKLELLGERRFASGLVYLHYGTGT